jgi:hypothetical protein
VGFKFVLGQLVLGFEPIGIMTQVGVDSTTPVITWFRPLALVGLEL